MGTKSNAQTTDRTSHFIGMIGEADLIRWAAHHGYHVYKGFDGHTPADYILDMDGELFRLEAKRIESVQHLHNNYYYVTVTHLRTDSFDYIFVSTEQGCYLIPSSECPKSTLSIKVEGDEYERNITRSGKYEKYKVEMPR